MKRLHSILWAATILAAASENLRSETYFYDFTFDAYQSYPQATIRYLSANPPASVSTLSYVSGDVNGCRAATLLGYQSNATVWNFETPETLNCGSGTCSVAALELEVNNPLNVGSFQTQRAGRGIQIEANAINFYYTSGTLVISENITSPGSEPVPEPRTAGSIGLAALAFLGTSALRRTTKGEC